MVDAMIKMTNREWLDSLDILESSKQLVEMYNLYHDCFDFGYGHNDLRGKNL